MPFRVDGAIETVGGPVRNGGGDTRVHLFGALIDDDGRWAVPLTIQTPVVLPAYLGAGLTIGLAEPIDLDLLDDLEVDGDVSVESNATFRLGDHVLMVQGNLVTQQSGKIVMDSDLARLFVAGNATFGSSATTLENAGALFSAGEFEIRGNLNELRAHFRPSGSHITRFTGDVAQIAQTNCWYTNCSLSDGSNPPAYASVEVTNPAGVTFQGRRVPVSGSFTVAADAVASFSEWMDLATNLDVAGTLTVGSGVEVTVGEMLYLRATGVLNNDGVMSVTGCTREDGSTINGTDPCN
jgi:hypothetical protein